MSATMFGLDVQCAEPLSVLDGVQARHTGRILSLEQWSGGAEQLGWPVGAELIADQREVDGSASFQIERDDHAGYLLTGSRYGAHLLSRDGRRLVCAPGTADDAAWQRLLIAQVLPFAAVLRGLEVFHASAVELDGRAVAVVGPSGAGKTSLALALCESGASFIADDVLVLEAAGTALWAHPGCPLANVRERFVRMVGAVEPAPLRALFLLDRRADGAAPPLFEPVTDPRVVLASTFNFVLVGPRRLRRRLEVCARIAELTVERVIADTALDAAALAVAVQERLSRSR
jgi:hypothetical protein